MGIDVITYALSKGYTDKKVAAANGGSGGGTNGKDGKDGFSPTVNVTEIDGGHEVNITDKNGTKSFDVMDGKRGETGSDGYTPVKGTDYWIESDKKEIVDEAIEEIKEIQPTFVELTESDILEKVGLSDEELEGLSTVISDNETRTDKTWSSSKIYSDISKVSETVEDLTKDLIDGGAIAVPTSYTNLVPTATTGATGNIYNGTGYLNGYRLNSSGNVVEEYPACVTGFMPYTQGATIRIVGATGLPDRGGMYVATYKENYERIAVSEIKGYVSDGGALVPRENNAYEFVINTDKLTNQYRIANFKDAKHIRVSCNPCDGNDLIVTINEEVS